MRPPGDEREDGRRFGGWRDWLTALIFGPILLIAMLAAIALAGGWRGEWTAGGMGEALGILGLAIVLGFIGNRLRGS